MNTSLRSLTFLCTVGLGLFGCSSTGPDATRALSEKRASHELPFSSFDTGSEALKAALREEGYDTFEGDHPGGDAESYLAAASDDSRPEVRVNTSWSQDRPLGSYELDGDVRTVGDPVAGITRLDASGFWLDCRDFQFELLTTESTEETAALLRRIRRRLTC
mgnify:CR=1 FL=1